MARKKIAEYFIDNYRVKVFRDPEWNEYVARLYVDGKLYEPADAFDDDQDSIIHTAQTMLKKVSGSHVIYDATLKPYISPSAKAIAGTRKNPRDIHIDIGSHNEKETVVRGRKNPRTTKKYYAVKLSAPNSTYGNPQRGWLVFFSDGTPIDFVDEEYSGRSALTSKYKNVTELVNVEVSAKIYKQAMKTLRAHGY